MVRWYCLVKKTKEQLNLEDKIYKLEDFPVFQLWDKNEKKFYPRALNKISITFLESLAYNLIGLKRDPVVEDELFEVIVKEFLCSVNYSYFSNPTYEAMGYSENAYCGGEGSIEEQFTCWALNIPIEKYRGKNRPYIGVFNMNSLDLSVLEKWLESSEYFKLCKSYNDKGKRNIVKNEKNKRRK